jgi:NAD(P)-dependent dehydrogenase (short-subunit alcohol dehydrogenase family)
MRDMTELAGRVVLVTGAGRGLGRQYALGFARHGARVVVNDLGGSVHGDGADTAVAEQVVAEIVQAGGEAVASCESVTSREGGTAIVGTALERFGRLDAVVCNAGILRPTPVEDLSPDEWNRTLGVHLDGSFHVAQAAYRAMKEGDGGRFVFISSSAGAFGQHDTAHYAAAKTGLWGLANVIALEGAPHGIAANVVLPFGATRMAEATIGDEIPPEAQVMLDAIRPELVVPLVVFLASPACELTHHMFSAGAGRFARVFVGLGPGWYAGNGVVPTPDDIAEHLAEIAAIEGAALPMSIYEEFDQLLSLAGGESQS